jgi:predicted amidohydrolase
MTHRMIPSRYEKYEKTVTVGCVNFAGVWRDKNANLEKIKSHIREAARQGINILAFPELALSGYECDEGCTVHGGAAETIPGNATEEIEALTKEFDMYVTYGMPEQDSHDKNIRYISCPLLGPEGYIGTYRKLHLGRPPLFTESKCFHGGNAIPVFETRFGPVGIQVCADFWMFPEISRVQMLKGARIIINCTASPVLPARPLYMTQMTGARATENMVYAASANLVGKENRLGFYGYSTIAGPAYPRFAHVYAQAEDKEEIISASLSFDKLHRFREAVTLEDLRRHDVLTREMNELNLH